MVTENNDAAGIEVRHGRFSDARLVFAAAGTILAGTLLARPTEVPEIDAEVVVAADGGNTGDGTVTASVVGVGPVVGVYNLTCTAEAANGGTFVLTDPDDAPVGTPMVMTAGAGAVSVFTRGGIQITITDGTEDFDTEDTFTLTVAATGEASAELLAPFDPNGSDGFEVPNHVLTYDVISATEKRVTVAADEANTGDGAVTAEITSPDEVLLGPYVLECTGEVANGGVFSLTDPFGVEVADDITLTPGAGNVSVFHVGGFRITIEDDTDWDTEDVVTITVREHFVYKGVRALNEGEVARERLLIHADGDDSNITAAHLDELRSFGIVARPVQQLGALDNQ